MAFKMNIARSSLMISLAFVASLIIAATPGIIGTLALAHKVGYAQGIGRAIGNQSLADMMHDALRADVFLAHQYSGEGRAAEKANEVVDSIKSHSETFRTFMAENTKIDMPDDVLAMIKDIVPHVEAYCALAAKTAKIAIQAPDDFPAINDEFQASFSDMEERMSGLGDAIRAVQDIINTRTLAIRRQTIVTSIIASLVAAAVALVSYVFTRRTIVAPVTAIAGAMRGLSEGRTNIAVPYVDNRNEVGEMARALQVFKENAAAIEKMQSEKAESERKAAEERRAHAHTLAAQFEEKIGTIVEGVSTASSELRQAAQNLSAMATQTSSQSGEASSAAEQTATNINAMSSATEGLSASISEISNRATDASGISGRAVSEATATNATVRNLADASQKIGEVVKFISEIAAQTNLLSLNATIEAARAGEAGKGFAVVASEVKALATQTAQATDQITAQIAAIQSETETAVRAIQSITDTINLINDAAMSIASAVAEQSAVSSEISGHVAQASERTGVLHQNVTGLSSTAQETGMAAGTLLHASDALAQQSNLLREHFKELLSVVRAA